MIGPNRADRRSATLRAAILGLVSLWVSGACRPSMDEIALAENLRRDNSRELTRALEHGATDRRVRAALAMARIQSPSYASPLIAATQDPPRELRLAALFALGQLGLIEGASPPSEVERAVEAALRDRDAKVVATALEALGKLAGEGLPETVTPFLAHDDPSVRAQAAMALFRRRFVPLWRKQADSPPELPEEAVAALIGRMTDPDVEARRTVVYGFSRYGQPEAVEALAARVEDEDEWTRLFAIRAIARSSGVEAADAVASALEDPSHRVRSEALQALAALGAAGRIGTGMVDDPSFHVRAAFAEALGEAAGSESRSCLDRLVQDDSPTVRAAAIVSLANRREADAADALERALDDDSWIVRAAAARAAGEQGPVGRARILKAWADEDVRVRTAAVEALGTSGDDPNGLLAEALSSSDLAVRGTAVAVLAGRPEEDADRLAALRRAYADSSGEAWVEIRAALVDALERLDGAEDLLGEIAAEDAAASVRLRAARLLDERGLPAPAVAAVPIEPSALLGLQMDDDPVVVLETSRGPIEIRTLAREAPLHVAQFVGLVRRGFYDGLGWHRVVSNFVIQGGDPRGDGWGGAGETLRDEINRVPYLRGTVGMPKAGKDTGSCQIFITHIPTPHLDGNYTVFGRVVSGLEVVDRIEVGDRIERAYVVE